jgi:hypothetical protein
MPAQEFSPLATCLAHDGGPVWLKIVHRKMTKKEPVFSISLQIRGLWPPLRSLSEKKAASA